MGVVLAPRLALLGEAATGYASGHIRSSSTARQGVAWRGVARQRRRSPASASGEQEMREEEGDFGFVFVKYGGEKAVREGA